MNSRAASKKDVTRRRLLPALVVDQLEQGASQSTLTGSTMALDIVGFTRLTEHFRKDGSVGTERLARVLLVVYNAIDQAVAQMGGEVVAISGDGLLAVFEGDDGARAAFAAATIRGDLARNGEGTSVDFRIGLARGQISVELYRQGERLAYGISGDPVIQAWQAESVAQPGANVAHASCRLGLGDLAEIEDCPGFFDLKNVAPEHVEVKYARDVASVDVSAFMPAELSHRAIPGEFRDAISVFVRIPDDATEKQTRATVELILELRDAWGGIGLRLDHSPDGKSILLLWGAPTATEHDGYRVVQMLTSLRAAAPISLAIGVCHGPVFAGFLGAETFQDYACIGTSTNFAARIANLSPSGEIWVNEEFANRADDVCSFTEAGQFEIKGFEQPKTVFRLSSIRKKSVREPRSQAVGREALEAELLGKIEELPGASAPWCVILEGEPGIGKSHLADRVCENMSTNVKLLKARADPLLRESMGSCIDLLRQAIGDVDTFRSLSDRSAKSSLVDTLRRGAPLIANAMGWAWGETSSRQYDAETNLRLCQEGVIAAFRMIADGGPLIIHIEDLHWIDDDSRTVIARLLLRSEERIGVLATARPRTRHLPEEVTVELHELLRLKDDDVSVLAQLLLDGRPSQRLNNILIQRSAGIPLYVTQLVRFLQERDLIVRVEDVWHLADTFQVNQLPGDARGLLVSRIDRMSQGARAAVSVASVLGAEGDVALVNEILERVGETVPDLAQCLNEAVVAGILGTAPHGRYAFSHALFRDAAYEMQLSSRRELLHRVAAQQLALTGAPSSTLAEHYDKAGLAEEARHHHTAAGRSAFDGFQNEASAWHLGRALALVPKASPAERFQLAFELNAVFQRTSDHVRQEDNLAAMEGLGSKLGDRERMQAIVAHANFMNARDEYDVCAEFLDGKLELLDKVNDPELTVRFNIEFVLALFFSETFNRKEEARERGKAAVRVARASGDDELLAEALLRAGMLYRYAEDETAKEYFHAALDVTKDLALKSSLLHRLGSIAFRQKESERGEALYAQAAELGREIGDISRAGHIDLGLAYEAENNADISKAEKHFHAAAQMARELRSVRLLSEAIRGLAVQARAAGQFQRALELLRTLDNVAHDSNVIHQLTCKSAELHIGDIETYRAFVPTGLEWSVEVGRDRDEVEMMLDMSGLDLARGDLATFLKYKDRIEELYARGSKLVSWGQTQWTEVVAHALDLKYATTFGLARHLQGDAKCAAIHGDRVADVMTKLLGYPYVMDIRDGGWTGSLDTALAVNMMAEIKHPRCSEARAVALRRLNQLADKAEAAGYEREGVWRECVFRRHIYQAGTTERPQPLGDVFNA